LKSAGNHLHAPFARITAGLVLIAVMQHKLEAIGVSGYQSERVGVPDQLGAEALVASEAVRWNVRYKAPEVLCRVGIGSDGNLRRSLGLVDSPYGSLPRPVDGVRREWANAALLPVARRAVGKIRDVSDK